MKRERSFGSIEFSLTHRQWLSGVADDGGQSNNALQKRSHQQHSVWVVDVALVKKKGQISQTGSKFVPIPKNKNK
jgi:hypothetical protein